MIFLERLLIVSILLFFEKRIDKQTNDSRRKLDDSIGKYFMYDSHGMQIEVNKKIFCDAHAVVAVNWALEYGVKCISWKCEKITIWYSQWCCFIEYLKCSPLKQKFLFFFCYFSSKQRTKICEAIRNAHWVMMSQVWECDYFNGFFFSQLKRNWRRRKDTFIRTDKVSVVVKSDIITMYLLRNWNEINTQEQK